MKVREGHITASFFSSFCVFNGGENMRFFKKKENLSYEIKLDLVREISSFDGGMGQFETVRSVRGTVKNKEEAVNAARSLLLQGGDLVVISGDITMSIFS